MGIMIWILGIIGFLGAIFLAYQIIAFWDQYKLNKLQEVYKNEHGNGNNEGKGETEEDIGKDRNADGDVAGATTNIFGEFNPRESEIDRTESDFEDESSSERPDRNKLAIDSGNGKSKVGNGKDKKRSKSNRFNPI